MLILEQTSIASLRSFDLGWGGLFCLLNAYHIYRRATRLIILFFSLQSQHFHGSSGAGFIPFWHFVIEDGTGKKIRRDAMEVLAVSNLPPIITWDTDCISRTVNENLHTIKSRTKLSMTNVISPCLEVIAALSNNPFVDPAASLTKQVSLLKQPTTYFPPAAHRWRSCIGQPMPHAIRYSINTRVCACCAGRLH